MNSLFRRAISITFNFLVIVPGIALLQFHGIIFWTKWIDVFFVGVSWSLLLEVVTFWAWFQRREDNGPRRFRIIKSIAITSTILLLVGPLYAVSNNIISNYEGQYVAASQYENRKSYLEEEVKRKRNAAERLLTYIEDKDDGWITYNRTETEIAAFQKELRELRPPPTKQTTIPWQEFVVVFMQMFSILIFQVVVVLAIVKTSEKMEIPKEAVKAGSFRDLLKMRFTPSE